MKKTVLSIGAHPDDIEIRNTGTMLLLKKMGWDLHYLSLSNGDLGTRDYTREEIGRIRTAEAKAAAELMGATFHPPFVGDLQIEHTQELVKKVCAIIRQVQPDIILTHPLEDYMEDHINTARLTCTAAIARESVPYETIPAVPAYQKPVAIYHCYPHGLTNRINRPVDTDFYVNIETTMPTKKAALELHKSQEAWLGGSQGFNSLGDLVELDSLAVGEKSGVFKYAECWTQHLHLGYADKNYNPLQETLKSYIKVGS